MPETTSTDDEAAGSIAASPSEGTTATADVASAIEAASFVRLSIQADGDAIAAAAVLVDGLVELDVPFHTRTVDPIADGTTDSIADETVDSIADGTTGPIDDGVGATDALTVGIGVDDPTFDFVLDEAATGENGSTERRSASLVAFDLVEQLDADPDPVLALAGSAADGSGPETLQETVPYDRAIDRGLIERRPGVATAPDTLADGIAHSTLFHAPFSGDLDASRSMLESIGIDARERSQDDTRHETLRRLASRVAIAATGPDAAPRAVETIARTVRPYATPSGPLATIGGLSDVLATVGVDRPDLALAFAIDPSVGRDRVLPAWRDHAVAAHAAVDSARTGRYDGVFVARIETERPSIVPTAARLIRDCYSPEPITLVFTAEPIDGRRHAAMASTIPRPIDELLSGIVAEFGGESTGTTTRGRTRIDDDRELDFDGQFIAAVRERLP